MGKRLLAIAGLVIVLLAGCSNNPATEPGEEKNGFKTATVEVDGRSVPCVTWQSGYSGGLSCDWSK